jgi:hypothetical protein
MLVKNRLVEAAAVLQEEVDHDCRMLQQLPIREPQRWTLWNASQLSLDQCHLRDMVQKSSTTSMPSKVTSGKTAIGALENGVFCTVFSENFHKF